MQPARPQVTRIYQNHHLDSTRWDVFDPRDGDIVVATPYKSGTTWTQLILLSLVHGDGAAPPDLLSVSPWVDARFMGTSKAQLGEQLAGLEGRRFVKTHLPLDGLPYYPQVRYVIVARDPRDVFMSLFNHYQSYTDLAYSTLNSEDRVGDPLPRCPEDPRVLWQRWMTRGWFEWESEGYPFWSNLGHVQSYWSYRALPNFLWLHYNDMLADLEGAVRKIAAFADIDVSEDAIARTVHETTFATVKRRAEQLPEDDDAARIFFEGGQRRFFFKGSNGRWRDVLTDEDLALYARAAARILSPDCAQWLESGGPI